MDRVVRVTVDVFVHVPDADCVEDALDRAETEVKFGLSRASHVKKWEVQGGAIMPRQRWSMVGGTVIVK